MVFPGHLCKPHQTPGMQEGAASAAGFPSLRSPTSRVRAGDAQPAPLRKLRRHQQGGSRDGIPPTPYLSSWSDPAWMGYMCHWGESTSPGKRAFEQSAEMAIKLQLHIRILAAAAEDHLLIRSEASGNAIHLNRELLRQNKKGGVPGARWVGRGREPDSRFLTGQPPGLQGGTTTRPGPAKTKPDPVQDPRHCVAMSWGPSLCIFSSKHPSGDELSLSLPKRQDRSAGGLNHRK